jgi:Delta7-sterol 5-desaturase
VFFVWQKARYLPGEGPEPAHIRQAIGLSLVNIMGHALLTSPMYVLSTQGYSRLYVSMDDYGGVYLLGSALAYLSFIETCVDWVHRLLHRPWLFKVLPRFHHQFRLPTPWVRLAFHPFADSTGFCGHSLMPPREEAIKRLCNQSG